MDDARYVQPKTRQNSNWLVLLRQKKSSTTTKKYVQLWFAIICWQFYQYIHKKKEAELWNVFCITNQHTVDKTGRKRERKQAGKRVRKDSSVAKQIKKLQLFVNDDSTNDWMGRDLQTIFNNNDAPHCVSLSHSTFSSSLSCP